MLADATRKPFVRLVLAVFVLAPGMTGIVNGEDTAGVMLAAQGLRQEALVEADWSATVPEYSSNMLLRIEFNGVRFLGPDGGTSVGTMVMNLCHDYDDDSAKVKRYFPGFSLYFSSLREDLLTGVELLADAAEPPSFRRIFEDVDGLGFAGVNIYNTQPIREPDPDKPVALRWNVRRGEPVKDPPGNYHRTIAGTWVPLTGLYREWFFTVWIDGRRHDVARYLLPESHATHLDWGSPINLHQEYFGAARGKLDTARTEVRYRDFKVKNEAGKAFPITKWKVAWVIDDDWENKDKRFGWRVEGPDLVSRCGHADDAEALTREKDAVLTLDQPE